MPPRIAIVGAGAIGLYYGGRLALAGQDVHFLARSELAVLRERGLRLREGDRDERLHPVQAYGRSEDIGPVDLVFVTLKTTANPVLPSLLRPLVGPQTVLVTLQNGLGNEELLAREFGSARVLGGLCFIASTRTGPGEVTCYHPGSISLGEFQGPASPRSRALAELLGRAGVVCRATESLREARWRKLVWNIPFNGLTIAAGGIPTDQVCADEALAREVRALMTEVRGAAAALGHVIPASFADEQFHGTPPMGAYQPSSLVDFLAGRPVEVEAIWGEPLRFAQAAGAQMPRLELLYALLRRLTRVADSTGQ